MMAEPCVIGIDLGTTGCKVVLYTLSGAMLAKSYRSNTMYSPKPGLAEQSPTELWQNICACIKDVLQKSETPPSTVRSLAVSSAGGIVAVDRKGAPLTNIIMQIDQRASKWCTHLDTTVGSIFFETAKNTLAGGVSPLPNLLWLKHEQPEIYKKTFAFLMPNGYIVSKLTDKFVGDISRCATLLLMDLRKKDWSPFLCEKTGIEQDRLPKLLSSETVVGTLSPTAAKETGLTTSTVVVAGLMDTVAACLGSGAFQTNDACIILGTFSKLCIVNDGSAFDPGFINCCYPGDSFLSFAVPDGGCGLAINWFLDTFAAETPQNTRYSEWDQLAEQLPPDGEFPFYLPFLAGGRSPEWDANTYSAFFNVRREHDRRHMYRALLEGIGYSARYNLDIFKMRVGSGIKVLRASGGGSNSDIWLQILANILDIPITRSNNPDSEAVGAAITAAFSVRGKMPLWSISNEKTFYPDKKYTYHYEQKYQQYLTLRKAYLQKQA